MSGVRSFAARVLPERFVNWFRRKRTNIIEAAGGGAGINPKTLYLATRRKLAPLRAAFRRGVRKLVPKRLLYWRRRRRITKQYLDALSYELMERGSRLSYLEGRVAARRDGFHERIVQDVLERTELVLQELDRRIEGTRARMGQRQDAVEEQLVQLREELLLLRQAREARDARTTVRDGDGNGRGPSAAEPRPAPRNGPALPEPVEQPRAASAAE